MTGAEMRQRIAEEAEIGEYTVIFADGFEDALLGVVQQFSNTPVVCYDYDKCIEVLMSRDGMPYEEAVEYFEFNTIGAWVGTSTPFFLIRPQEQ
jgi:hypothetical protein